MSETCEVGLSTADCHGAFLDRVRTRCFSCGNPACRGCSELVRRYYFWRRVRLCNDCMQDRAGDIASGAIVLNTNRREVA